MQYLIGFLGGFFSSLIATPITISIARKTGLVDNPKTHKHPAIVHTGIIPRAGGLPIFLGLLVGYALVAHHFSKNASGIFLGAVILIIVGVLDDRFDISPYIRFCINILVACIVVLFGIHLNFLTIPFWGVLHLNQAIFHFTFFGNHSIYFVADAITVLWIVWMMNAINWSSGVDGQLPGIIVVGAAVLGIVAYRFALSDYTQVPVILLSVATVAAYLGFLPWSFYPQKIMPGYSGAALGGYLLAILAILSGAKLATIIIVLGVPMADGVYAVFRRISRGQSPFRGDREHFHHLLLARGWSKRSIAVFYWVTCALLGVLSLQLHSKGKLFAVILIAAVFGGTIAWLRYFTEFSKQPDPDNG